jgi:site-specific recombinase XerD
MVKIDFQFNEGTKNYVKKFSELKWSATHKAFYIPFSKDKVNRLFLYLREQKYYVDYSLLKSNTKEVKQVKQGINIKNIDLKPEYKPLIHSFVKWMAQKRYSINTITTYKSMVITFFKYHNTKAVIEITKEDIIDFNINYILANNFSYTYQNQLVNAIKLFYKQITSSTLDLDQLDRPKKAKRLPEVLSLDEVKELLTLVSNTKHKALLSLLYSCGLRIGEALSLKLNSVDFNRLLIHVKSGKGRKDRFVPLSTTMVNLLQRYYAEYKPKDYVFEGRDNAAYSPVSARQVLKRAVKQTAIQKSITLHTLRHSYATHLLENGTDIRFIQELLGHKNPKTTMLYTHISTTSLEKIKNPFDDFKI